MSIILAFVTGGLYATGIYMILRRNIVKLVIGFMFISNATNLLIFSINPLIRGSVPIIEEGKKSIEREVADPLPQALILTAIVISFGLLAFAIVLIKRFYQVVGSGDVDMLKATDKI